MVLRDDVLRNDEYYGYKMRLQIKLMSFCSEKVGNAKMLSRSTILVLMYQVSGIVVYIFKGKIYKINAKKKQKRFVYFKDSQVCIFKCIRNRNVLIQTLQYIIPFETEPY